MKETLTSEKHSPLVLLILSVFSSLAGVILLRFAHAGWGGYLLLGGAICFAAAGSRNSVVLPEVGLSGQSGYVRSRAAVYLGLFFVLAAAYFSLHTEDSLQKGLESVLLWVLGMILFSTGVLYVVGWTLIPWRVLWQKIQSNRKEVLLVSGLFMVSLMLRTINLSSHPYAVANDGGTIAYDALHLLRGDFHNLFGTATAAYPILSYVPGALSTLIFGNTIFAMRVVSSIEGALSVLFLYLLCRELFPRRTAWIASFLLMVMPAHIHFSRVSLNNILMCLHATLILWLLVRAVRNGRGSSYLWAGLATGAALYAYSGSRLVMALAGGIILVLSLVKRGYLKQNWTNVLIFFGAVFVVTLPQFAFYSRNPDLFGARFNAVGIFGGDWINLEAARVGKTAWEIFMRQMSEAGQIFISIRETIGFYAAAKPLFSLVESALLVMGMGYAVSRINHPVYLVLVIWFWAVVLLGGAMTIPATATQRFIPAFPAAVILIADALDQAVVMLHRQANLPKRLMNLGIVLLVAWIAINHLVDYFHNYRINGYYNRPYEEVQYESIDIELQLGKEYRYVLIGAPRLYLEFGDYRYLLDGYDQTEVFEAQEINSALLYQKADDLGVDASTLSLTDSPARPTFYVAIPDRVDELRQIVQEYPGGTWIREGRRYRPAETLFYGYIYPAKAVHLNSTVDTPVDHPFNWSMTALLFFYLAAAVFLQTIFYPKLFRKRADEFYAHRRTQRLALKSWFRRLVQYLLDDEVSKDG